MVGTALRQQCEQRGIEVVRLVRQAQTPADVEIWNDRSDLSPLENLDAVIHLAGSPIAGRRWTASVKQEIYHSRVQHTAQLVAKLVSLKSPPRCMIGASAVGFYGDRGDEILGESSAAGNDFLSHVVRDWEQAYQQATSVGIRVATLRFGMILSEQGGALAKLLPLFRYGLGGRLGPGNQWWSWVSLADAVRVIGFVGDTESVRGAVNVTSPNPLTNAEFTQILAKSLGRPAWFAVPAVALRLGLGEMSGMLLSSARVEPQVLSHAGFTFHDPELADCLK